MFELLLIGVFDMAFVVSIIKPHNIHNYNILSYLGNVAGKSMPIFSTKVVILLQNANYFQ